MPIKTKDKRTSIEQMLIDAKTFGAPIDELQKWIHNNPQSAKLLAQKFDSHQYNDKSIVYTQLSTQLELINLLKTPLQLKILLIFIQCSNQSGELQISNKDLQRMTGNHDKKQITKTLNYLLDTGFLTIRTHGKCKKPTIYMLNPEVAHCGKINKWNDEDAFWKLVADEEKHLNWLLSTKNHKYILNTGSTGKFKDNTYHKFNIIEFIEDNKKTSDAPTASDVNNKH